MSSNLFRVNQFLSACPDIEISNRQNAKWQGCRMADFYTKIPFFVHFGRPWNEQILAHLIVIWYFLWALLCLWDICYILWSFSLLFSHDDVD
jgi:hypothetical protein